MAAEGTSVSHRIPRCIPSTGGPHRRSTSGAARRSQAIIWTLKNKLGLERDRKATFISPRREA